MTYAAARSSFHPLGYLAAATALLAAFTSFANITKKKPNDAMVPTSIGTYWVYRGQSLYGQDGSQEITAIDSKVTIVGSIKSADGTFSATLLKIHNDLVRKDTGKQTADDEFNVDLVYKNDRYYKNYSYENRSAMETWDWLKRAVAAKSAVNLPTPDEAATSVMLPAEVGSSWGSVSDVSRSDGLYCWTVLEVRSLAKGSEVADCPLPADSKEYTLAFRTLPDEQLDKFVPGVGFTELNYSHHGTVIESNQRLVEFHPGS